MDRHDFWSVWGNVRYEPKPTIEDKLAEKAVKKAENLKWKQQKAETAEHLRRENELEALKEARRRLDEH